LQNYKLSPIFLLISNECITFLRNIALKKLAIKQDNYLQHFTHLSKNRFVSYCQGATNKDIKTRIYLFNIYQLFTFGIIILEYHILFSHVFLTILYIQ